MSTQPNSPVAVVDTEVQAPPDEWHPDTTPVERNPMPTPESCPECGHDNVQLRAGWNDGDPNYFACRFRQCSWTAEVRHRGA